jgi:hypothetical protein
VRLPDNNFSIMIGDRVALDAISAEARFPKRALLQWTTGFRQSMLPEASP